MPTLEALAYFMHRPTKDNLWWATTFGGRQLLVKNDLRWKSTFGGRRPSVEDNLQLRATSKQGKKLRFGMLTVITNIRSIKVIW